MDILIAHDDLSNYISKLYVVHEYNKYISNIQKIVQFYKSRAIQQFNQHFATIGEKLGTKFNDSDSSSWNLPESIHEFRFANVDVVFAAKQLSLCSARPNIDVLGFDSYLLNVGSKFSSQDRVLVT